MPWIQLEATDGERQAGHGGAPQAAPHGATHVNHHADHEADHRSRLLMVRPADVVVRLNGTPAPRLCELRLGDQLQFDDRVLMHVTIHQGSSVGPVAEELVGKECLVCRVPFKARSLTYVCVHCGVAIHCEDARKDARKEAREEAREEARDEEREEERELVEEEVVAPGVDDNDDPEQQEPLECARLSDACPFCHRPVWMEEGFLYEPAS